MRLIVNVISTKSHSLSHLEAFYCDKNVAKLAAAAFMKAPKKDQVENSPFERSPTRADI